jgi:hypothetical protein
MIVKLTTEQSVYIEIDGYTYYIDHSLRRANRRTLDRRNRTNNTYKK